MYLKFPNLISIDSWSVTVTASSSIRMQIILVILIFGIIQISALKCDRKNTQTSTKSVLEHKLLCDYDKSVRPYKSEENATHVMLAILVRDVSYFGRTQSLQINGHLIFV